MPLPSPRYHKLQANTNANNGSKNDAASEKEESFQIEDEERAWSDITARDPAMAERRASRRRQIWSIVMSLRSLVDTILLLVILGLLLDREWQKPSWFEVGGDITGFAPKSTYLPKIGTCLTIGCLIADDFAVSQQIKSFSPDPTFVPENGSEFFTDAVKSRWLSIVPSKCNSARLHRFALVRESAAVTNESVM